MTTTQSSPPPPPPTAGRRLSVVEAASYLGISTWCLRAWTRRRRLPWYRLGKRVLLDIRDLDAFLRVNRIEAREPAHAPTASPAVAAGTPAPAPVATPGKAPARRRRR